MDDSLEKMPEFFMSSNNNEKDWTVKRITPSRFQITKPGHLCTYCSDKEKQTIYRSVRVQYCKFKNKLGQEKTEFEWINSKCHCLTVIIYKNGKIVFNPSKDYSQVVRIFDDIKNIPSAIEVHYKP